MKTRFCATLLLLLAAAPARAQPFALPRHDPADPRSVDDAVKQLARRVLAVYRDSERRTDLDNRFRLQIVAGRYGEATGTIATLRALLLANRASPRGAAIYVEHEIFADAQASRPPEHLPLDAALQRSFRRIFARLDDRTAALVGLYLFSLPALQQARDDALKAMRAKPALTLDDALGLVRAYQVERTYAALAPLVGGLIADEDRRRYVIDRDVRVPTSDGATVCALVVRPRAPERLVALLNFTIYSDPGTSMYEARRTASNGYAGVEGYTRGKACSPDAPIPIEHDGDDARTVIDWISRQPWSDGRVGMYGGSYEGFTQWAAAKHMPKALKALMPSVTFAPGIDFPMPGAVYQSYGYPWPFYTTDVKALDDVTYGDHARWNRLDHEWYVSGRAYRDLDRIDGTPNPIWNRWVAHPSYDAYWQRAIPYQREFAAIDIPVLTTTGYYDDGQIGALYYFTQHYKYNPRAEHYFLVGPYDHIGGQRGTRTDGKGALVPLRGLALDPVAEINIGALRYQWFDYVFKSAAKPALLADKVNYEVMGANLWRHAPSIAAMSDDKLTLHVSGEQTIDFADRSDADELVADPFDSFNGVPAIVDRTLRTRNAITVVSDPFPTATEVSGRFSGRVDFVANKRDFDFDVQLYERTPTGEYVQLSYYWSRASYVADRTRRQLLTPGQRQTLDFESPFVTSRQLRAGSRVVVVLGILKRPDMQINYGTGKDVSDETIADAKSPLNVHWLDGSFIAVPLRHGDAPLPPR
jgi:uncharacterized protein